MNLKGKGKYIGIGISVITIFIFAFIYGPLNLLRTFLSLPQGFVVFFLAAMCLHILSFMFWASRISILSRANGIRIRFSKALDVVVTSLFAASLTPGYVGGEPVRVKKLIDYGANAGTSTAIVLGERGLDSIFFTSVFFIVVITGLEVISGQLRLYATIGIIVLIFFIVFLILSIRMHKFAGRIGATIERLISKLRTRGRFLKINEMNFAGEVQSYSSSTRRIFIGKPKYLAAGISVTALMWLSDFSVPLMLLIGFGVFPSFLYVIFIQIILVLISLIPLTPGSAGLMEVLMIATFSIFLSHSHLVAFVIMWRFITFYFNIILGSFALHKVVTE
ncbi:MAG: flippase-like domain-containing protein [Thermoplasmatales archaeon]